MIYLSSIAIVIDPIETYSYIACRVDEEFALVMSSLRQDRPDFHVDKMWHSSRVFFSSRSRTDAMEGYVLVRRFTSMHLTHEISLQKKYKDR